MCALVELSNITYDPLESNKTSSEDSTLEYSTWHILFFNIVQKTKGLFWCGLWGVLFLAFKLSLLEFGFFLLIMNYFITKSVVENLSNLILTLTILDSLCKIYHQILG